MTVVDHPLHFDRVQHLLLVRVGPDLEAGEGHRDPIGRACVPRLRSEHRRAGRDRDRGRIVRTRPSSSRSRRWPNFCIRDGVAAVRQPTFHSTPSSRALVERFDDPTYAVSKPVWRRNSHAFA